MTSNIVLNLIAYVQRLYQSLDCRHPNSELEIFPWSIPTCERMVMLALNVQ